MSGWHLDKKVPIALIGTILVNICASIWWASSAEARIKGHESQMLEYDKYFAKREEYDRETIKTLSRLDERVKTQTELLHKIENKITP